MNCQTALSSCETAEFHGDRSGEAIVNGFSPDIEAQGPSLPVDGIHVTTWKLLVYCVLAPGIYHLAWLAERRNWFNRIAGEEFIKASHLVVISFLIYIQILMRADAIISTLNGAILFGLYIYLFVKIAEAMEHHILIHQGRKVKFNRCLIILANIYYLNHKMGTFLLERQEDGDSGRNRARDAAAGIRPAVVKLTPPLCATRNP